MVMEVWSPADNVVDGGVGPRVPTRLDLCPLDVSTCPHGFQLGQHWETWPGGGRGSLGASVGGQLPHCGMDLRGRFPHHQPPPTTHPLSVPVLANEAGGEVEGATSPRQN